MPPEKAQAQRDALEKAHPGWRTIVGEFGEDTPFRRWLHRRPYEYALAVNNADSWEVVAAALSRFKASQRLRAPDVRPGHRATVP